MLWNDYIKWENHILYLRTLFSPCRQSRRVRLYVHAPNDASLSEKNIISLKNSFLKWNSDLLFQKEKKGEKIYKIYLSIWCKTINSNVITEIAKITQLICENIRENFSKNDTAKEIENKSCSSDSFYNIYQDTWKAGRVD